MAISKIRLRPGIDVEQTPTLNSGGWSASQLIRWREGLVEKIGGWQSINPLQPVTGTGRGMHSWSDLLGNPYIAVGTEQRLQLFSGGGLYDITPLRMIDNITPSFSTVATSRVVKVTDAANTADSGDWINIPIPVAVGGIIIQGFYQIQTIIDQNNYTINASTAALSTVNNTGAVPTFTSVMSSSVLTVTLANNGVSNGSLFTIQVATNVGGIAMAANSSYVATNAATNTFTITPGPVASSGTTVAENGGSAAIFYLVHTGYSSNTALMGYGIGPYGIGPYGGGGTNASTGSTAASARLWFLDNWGQDLIGNYNGSPIYVWAPPETGTNVALAINDINFPTAVDPPVQVNASFVAMPEQIMVALGVDPPGGGQQDPNLVRWSDVSDFTDWLATAANQAGSFRIPTGSFIVGGLQGQQFGYIWTNIDFWIMQYIGAPLVFGFIKIASGCELISPHGAGIYNSIVYWAGVDNFYLFDGNAVSVIPCPVYDVFYQNINTSQLSKVWCWVNSHFNEIWWFYPSANSLEVDSYVKFTVTERAWDFGTLIRTCGVDETPYGHPINTDTSGNIMEHELGYDANGLPMFPSVMSGYVGISDGTYFTSIERIIGDFKFIAGPTPNNRVFMTLYFQDYPEDTPTVVGPLAWSPSGPDYNIVRGRGRMVAIEITSSDPGVFWRMGLLRHNGQPSGRR